MGFNKDDKLPAIENNNFRQIKINWEKNKIKQADVFQVYLNEIRFTLLFFLIRAHFLISRHFCSLSAVLTC